MTKVDPNVKRATLQPHIVTNVAKGAAVRTDELRSYANLSQLGYNHGAVNHSKDMWVSGKHHTNNLKGFWPLIKRSFSGTHVHVSRRHLSEVSRRVRVSLFVVGRDGLVRARFVDPDYRKRRGVDELLAALWA